MAQRRDVRIGAGSLPLRSVRTEAEAVASRDMTVFAEAQATIIAAQQLDAVAAWRRGDGSGAERIAQQNISHLQRLQAAAPSAAIAQQLQEYQNDANAFRQVSAASSAGRSYGLRSNAYNRARMRRATTSSGFAD